MAIPTCPACTQSEAIYLAYASEGSHFSYYRCPCGHVWGVNKDKPRVIHHVTPFPSKPDAPSVE